MQSKDQSLPNADRFARVLRLHCVPLRICRIPLREASLWDRMRRITQPTLML